MRVIQLKNNKDIYSSNVYLVLGDWNKLDDMNTLVDVGASGHICKEINALSTGVGKIPVNRVAITHGHFDHIGVLPLIKQKYDPTVFAYGLAEGVDFLLADGQMIRMGDRDFEVIHTPGHSSDSICLYCKDEKVLFSGDVPIQILSPGGTYETSFVNALERLAALRMETIYPGHGSPIADNAEETIQHTLTIVKSVLVA
ncbi:MAG: MBL fold metallo-hydrolase [Nitrospirae bacterium]|nr:MBL fold metallo-hydrolase [Nitrospirota bacterium]